MTTPKEAMFIGDQQTAAHIHELEQRLRDEKGIIAGCYFFEDPVDYVPRDDVDPMRIGCIVINVNSGAHMDHVRALVAHAAEADVPTVWLHTAIPYNPPDLGELQTKVALEILPATKASIPTPDYYWRGGMGAKKRFEIPQGVDFSRSIVEAISTAMAR